MAVLIVGTAVARAQVFVVDAGTSTLYQAQGGSLQMQGASYNATLGGGVVAGRFVGGATLEKQIGRAFFTAGSQIRQCNLPTDLFDADHRIYAIGASVTTKVRATKLYALAGTTSTEFGSPFFEGSHPRTPMAMLLVERPLSPHTTVEAQVVATHDSTSHLSIAQSMSAIASLIWKPERRWTVALAGGSGNDRPYGAFSIDTTHRLWDLKAAYIYASDQFQRVGESSFLTPEPVRENVLLTIRPAHELSFTVGRQNSLVPQTDGSPSIRSTVDQASASLQVEQARLSASVFESNYAGRRYESLVLAASREITPRIHVGGSYLASRERDSLPDGPPSGPSSTLYLANAEESLTPRWTVTEIANLSNGQATYGMGGSFLSNFATVNLDYQTYYVPTRATGPFEQAVIVNVLIHLPGGLALHGGSFVGPDGNLLYTAEAQGLYARGPQLRQPEQFHSSMGPMLLHGCVVDTAGKPVMGAALMINQTPIFTDSRGCFALRERRARVHPLSVMVDQFLDGGHYRVVSAPHLIRSAAGDVEPESLIVVALLPHGERPS
ncbi:hypothetical protein SAMN05421770_101512 [Granulicella rosea]|uniref:Uncharacterized protein n=1 Tax=Granulicella rosea TaxID=474952 RepID=A0A239DKX0_9BACT|nr:hypothetical protein [Granulicella rosea]SNS32701.1 hypothetical protein SAMN05421770_101512 [Granulicella rosea]